MDVLWSPAARSDFETMLHQLIDTRRGDAYHLCAAVDETVSDLASNPYSGQIGRVTATRELLLTGHGKIVVYTVRPEAVYVLRLLPGEA